MNNIVSLLSSKARESFNQVPVTDLLNPTFVIDNQLLTKRDIEKLSIIRESYELYAMDGLKKIQIGSSRQLMYHLEKIMCHYKEEILVVLLLNTKNEIIKMEQIFKGTVNSSIAHPREIFRKAVQYETARIVVAHNHPSGDSEPSGADIQFTKRMVECGDLMGIELLDHVIIGKLDSISLREATNLWN
ncbi:DNA repair protein RadC [Ruoffia tabacinasalis]|uniref:DNA repair protein RadC n=1 Tax=Ruoffia tabacinasalis TaxID=87458 RepID=A0A5R9EH42_9LACT|nr:DNA repair protein RadC [Ruoffia tabacinasalis]TLQ49510.1 DNA repair protein RadC [Ruoffia tabacinasalis]